MYEKNGSDESIMTSIDKLQGLNDVLLIGGDLSYNVYNYSSDVFDNYLNIKSVGTPLQRNYFIDASNQFDPYTENKIAISNSFCKVNSDGTIDRDNCGLLYTASGGLERMSIDDDLLETFDVMKKEGFTDVEVTILTQNGNLETKTISFDNYRSMDSTMFPNECKRYSQMAENHCESCDLMARNTNNNSELSQELGEVEDLLNQKKAAEDRARELTQGIQGFQNFGTQYKQPLNNYQQSNGRTITKIEYQELDVSDDMITTTYIAGISLLAAFIIYKVMES